MRFTLISHFYNEAFLLPFWLRHHLAIFDHGILIDYSSTDASVEICREIAPHWEVRRTLHTEFDAQNVDQEVMAIEREVSGWKMALNTTEFLGTADREALIGGSNDTNQCIALGSVVLVDPLGSYGRKIDPDVSLVAQCPWGYFDPSFEVRRLRFLHNYPDGNYNIGRHDSFHPYRIDRESFVFWFAWAPYYNVSGRKLQIQDRMSQRDRQLNLGYQHIVTEEELDRRWEAQQELCRDLREDEHYRRVVSACLRKWPAI